VVKTRDRGDIMSKRTEEEGEFRYEEVMDDFTRFWQRFWKKLYRWVMEEEPSEEKGNSERRNEP
jgi:hypothetical protein